MRGWPGVSKISAFAPALSRIAFAASAHRRMSFLCAGDAEMLAISTSVFRSRSKAERCASAKVRSWSRVFSVIVGSSSLAISTALSSTSSRVVEAKKIRNDMNFFLRLSHRDPPNFPPIACEHDFKSRKGLPGRANQPQISILGRGYLIRMCYIKLSAVFQTGLDIARPPRVRKDQMSWESLDLPRDG